MANRGPIYGLDAELQAKAAAKYDPRKEQMVRDWLAQVTGLPVEGDFHEALKSGVVLCTALNKIKPGTCKINKMNMPFMQMENIASYLEGCAAIGVPQPDIFVTVDLFEGKDMMQVIQNVFALARTAEAQGFRGPSLGPKLAEKQDIHHNEAAVLAARAELPALQAGVPRGLASGAQIHHADIVRGQGKHHFTGQ